MSTQQKITLLGLWGLKQACPVSWCQVNHMWRVKQVARMAFKVKLTSPWQWDTDPQRAKPELSALNLSPFPIKTSSRHLLSILNRPEIKTWNSYQKLILKKVPGHTHTRGLEAYSPPRIFQNDNYQAKILVKFRQNHLIFGQSLDKIFGQETSAPPPNHKRTPMFLVQTTCRNPTRFPKIEKVQIYFIHHALLMRGYINWQSVLLL